MTYRLDCECLEDAVVELVRQFREQNPQLSKVKLEMGDGVTVTISVAAKFKKHHPLQRGPTVTTTGGYLP